MTILAAAANDQLSSSLPPAKHGLFSYFLMKGLEGNAAGPDNIITATRLEQYLMDHVPTEAAKLGRSQTPQIMGDGERVVAVIYPHKGHHMGIKSYVQENRSQHPIKHHGLGRWRFRIYDGHYDSITGGKPIPAPNSME